MSENGLPFEVRGGEADRVEGVDDSVPTIQQLPHRFLLFGDSGNGKTMAGCRAVVDAKLDLDAVWMGEVKPKGDDKVFALLTETNGVSAAKAVNPKVRYVVSTDMATTRAVIKAAKDGLLTKQFGTERLVIDGLTEIQQQILDAMYPNGVPEKVDWNGWNDAMRRFLRFLRSIDGMDVYCTALSREKAFEEGEAPQVMPDLQGRQIPLGSMQYFDAVGYLTRVQDTDAGGRTRNVHVAQFTLPSRYKVKPCQALQGNVIPVMSAWGDVLRGALEPGFIRHVASDRPAPAAQSGGDTSEGRPRRTGVRA